MKRILIVDDDELIRESISDGLNQAGYETRSAPDGRAGLRQVSSFRPNVIVTDVMMPDMDGIEFLGEIRKRGGGVPIIVMSGNEVGAQFLKAALLLGARATLRKPFTVDALVNELKRVCGA